MNREQKLEAAVVRLITYGQDMEDNDRLRLENTIVGEFEDLLPTYKGVKGDGISRLYEWANRKLTSTLEEPPQIEETKPARRRGRTKKVVDTTDQV